MIDRNKLLQLNREPLLSPWFRKQLNTLMEDGVYHDNIEGLHDSIVRSLGKYRVDHGIDDVVIGMSGGIDSAVTGALFKNAGWNVTGVTLPILQDEQETIRGEEAIQALQFNYESVDLTESYEHFRNIGAGQLDTDIRRPTLSISEKSTHVRLGNLRARLRMATLYNLAGKLKGCVGSTDNFSELAAGFWTLHGDVGDIAPIQSLTKSWEVPALAEFMGVPQSIISAVPTDGLGIANGDEDQFGFSYLEFDIAMFTMFKNIGNIQQNGTWSQDTWSQTCRNMELEMEQDLAIVENVKGRIASTVYKRQNPFNLPHPLDENRYSNLEQLDNQLRR
jgi:NAD+ synthetase